MKWKLEPRHVFPCWNVAREEARYIARGAAALSLAHWEGGAVVAHVDGRSTAPDIFNPFNDEWKLSHEPYTLLTERQDPKVGTLILCHPLAYIRWLRRLAPEVGVHLLKHPWLHWFVARSVLGRSFLSKCGHDGCGASMDSDLCVSCIY